MLKPCFLGGGRSGGVGRAGARSRFTVRSVTAPGAKLGPATGWWASGVSTAPGPGMWTLGDGYIRSGGSCILLLNVTGLSSGAELVIVDGFIWWRSLLICSWGWCAVDGPDDTPGGVSSWMMGRIVYGAADVEGDDSPWWHLVRSTGDARCSTLLSGDLALGETSADISWGAGKPSAANPSGSTSPTACVSA